MTQNTETSVMFALAELQQAEVARQSEEKAREARRRQEKEEREQAERERQRAAEQQAHRVAEAAARLQVEVDAREAAARERVTAMQQALIQLKAERDVLHGHLNVRDSAIAAAPTPTVVRLAMGGVALSVLAVVAMAVVLLNPPARPRVPEVTTKIVYLPAPTPAIPSPAAPAPEAAAPLVAKPALAKHPGATHHNPTSRPVTPNPTACGDDPLCGLSFKP